jgi:glycogen(starch) synthase
VRFLGAVPPADVPAVINSATLVLMPSRREGLPLVAIEAAFMGRPVVAVRRSGLPEVVVDGETGLLAAPEDVEGLAAAALAVLEDPPRGRRMGRAARRRAGERFSIAQCAARFDELYRALASAGRPATALTTSG